MLPRETRLTPFLRSLALILGFLVGSAALAAEAVFPPGSRIGLEPLAGMVPSKRFTGFEDAGQGVAFTFVEMPSDAYREIASGLTAERLKDQGIELKTREELKLGDRNAVLVAGEQKLGELTLRKWFLVVEDPSLTIEDQVAALPFRLTERAGFRPVRAMAGNALFLTDGSKDVVVGAEQPIAIVAQSTAPAPPPQQR